MIVVEGNCSYIPSTEFKPKVDKCLKTLQKKAPLYHSWLSEMGVKIRAFSKSGAAVTENTIDIARRTFDASETWLASVLVHETIHIWQYRSKKNYYGQEAEKEGNKYQLAVLRLVGAPQSEIAYQLSQTGNHFDLNGDGVYDEKDYELRDY